MHLIHYTSHEVFFYVHLASAVLAFPHPDMMVSDFLFPQAVPPLLITCRLGKPLSSYNFIFQKMTLFASTYGSAVGKPF